ncbi:hypothetical protein ACPWSR_06885 [Alloiococcus sp. CFN-8]|uniref:hypothetical protein n=1 Tax=Alloiococcus sp. CFN-8 TaxID=3416081 RepID=UPI003CF1DB6D
MTNKGKDLWKSINLHIRENKSVFILYMILRVIVVLAMVASFINRNYENVFFCVLTLILFMIPSFIEVNFHIDLPTTLEVVILLFIFASQILGEMSSYYITYPFWDTMLHTINGFLAAAIGFSLVDILNDSDKFTFQLSPIYMAVVAFCFSMTIGVLWEFFEFFMDMVFRTDMQKDTIINGIYSVILDPTNSNKVVAIKNINDVIVNGKSLGLGGYIDIGLIDTMKDLIVNFIGAVVFSIIGFFYVKHRGQGSVARRFIPKLIRQKDK